MSFYYNIQIPQQILEEEKIKKLQKKNNYTDEFAKQFTINSALMPLLSAFLGNKNVALMSGVNGKYMNHDKATIEDDNVKTLQDAYAKAQQLRLPLLTGHSANADITESVTLDMLQRHFNAYKKAAGISPRQRITKALVQQWGDLMNQSRSVLTEQGYFVNNNVQRIALFQLFWQQAPAQNTLSSSKLASALLMPAVHSWQDLIITSNYYQRSLQQQK